MVLESVIVPEKWEKHPKRMLLVGFVYSTIGLFLGLYVFGKYASISGIFLTTIPLVVVMYRAIVAEEGKDLKICKESLMLKEHRHILSFFIYLFLGLTFSYTFWFSVLPDTLVSHVCSSQIETIRALGSKLSAQGSAISPELRLERIILNNLRVLGFCILFSFLYGAGAIFILTWNASVIGVAIGNTIRNTLSALGRYSKSNTIADYFTALPTGLSYLVHGIPEIASYFLGALAGGIISVAVVCHHYKTPEFWKVIKDSISLLVLSLIVLVVAGLIEVYITPILL